MKKIWDKGLSYKPISVAIFIFPTKRNLENNYHIQFYNNHMIEKTNNIIFEFLMFKKILLFNKEKEMITQENMSKWFRPTYRNRGIPSRCQLEALSMRVPPQAAQVNSWISHIMELSEAKY